MLRITGKNRYCGPAVIAAITGLTTDEVSRVARHVTGQRAIMGMYNYEVKQTLNHIGVPYKETYLGRTKPTLGKALDDFGGTAIVQITGHYILLHDGMLYDTRNKEGVPFDKNAPYRRCRAKFMWEVPRETIGLPEYKIFIP